MTIRTGTSEYQAAWILDEDAEDDGEDDDDDDDEDDDAYGMEYDGMAGGAGKGRRNGMDDDAPELEPIAEDDDGGGSKFIRGCTRDVFTKVRLTFVSRHFSLR